jgi:hypothetical protein
MSRKRTTFQIFFQEPIDEADDWRTYGGRVWSITAAMERVSSLERLRPTRRYKVIEVTTTETSREVWTSGTKEPA